MAGTHPHHNKFIIAPPHLHPEGSAFMFGVQRVVSGGSPGLPRLPHGRSLIARPGLRKRHRPPQFRLPLRAIRMTIVAYTSGEAAKVKRVCATCKKPLSSVGRDNGGYTPFPTLPCLPAFRGAGIALGRLFGPGQSRVDQFAERLTIRAAFGKRNLDHLDRNQLLSRVDPESCAPGAGPVKIAY